MVVVGRIVVSRFHFAPHATIASGAIVAFMALSAVSEWTEFFFPTVPALWLAGLFGSGLILAGLVYYHLRVCVADAALVRAFGRRSW